MSEGMLEVVGTIRPAALWPSGSSDADTSTLLVQAKPGSFRFRESKRDRFRVTRAFERAVVVGRVRKQAIDERHHLVVRLQGIDAPELHYRAPCLVAPKDRSKAQQEAFSLASGDYRQPLGETATLALREYLGIGMRDETVDVDHEIPCILRTRVDEPNEVFDTYGRMVAEVFVKKGRREVSLNQWLAKSGWAVPSLYASMSADEISTFVELGNHARRAGAGIWRHYQSTAGSFGWLRYRGKGAEIDPGGDEGPVVFPKLFRRQCTWNVNRRGKTTKAASLRGYLEAADDAVFVRNEFVAQGPTAAKSRRLSDFVHGQGELSLRPVDMVFQEAPSNLLRDGNVVRSW